MMSFLLKGRLALIQKEGKREEGMSSAKSTFPFVQWNGTAHACLLACLLISGDTGDADRFVSNSIKARGGGYVFVFYTSYIQLPAKNILDLLIRIYF